MSAQHETDKLADALLGVTVDRIKQDGRRSPSGVGFRIDFKNGASLWFESFDLKVPRVDVEWLERLRG